jgi:hypothetical protein
MRPGPKSVIEDAETILDFADNRSKVNSFLHTFSKCEVYIRPILFEYYKLNGKEIKFEDIALNANEIKYALSEKGIKIPDQKLITRIFGAKKAKGDSSCKWLRNKISHELKKRELQEVCNRYDDLIQDMTDFITIINGKS